MCCLFGLFDYKRSLSAEQKTRVIRILGTAAEARGTDAAGIAYNDGGRLQIFKRPGPAHNAVFRVPAGADVVMGHTRMTTQGSAAQNRNNHPFPGETRRQPFALAHNGVLWNDKELRKRLKLPRVKIETLGLYLYASTEEILQNALQYIRIEGDAPEKVNLHCGEILRIRRTGGLEADKFDDSKLFDFPPYCCPYRRGTVRQSGAEELRKALP